MSDPRALLERETHRFVQPDGAFERLELRRDRKRRNQRVRAGVLGLAIAIAIGWLAIDAIRSTPIPTDEDRSEDLGIFAPVAGRIVFQNARIERGYDAGLWAVDPNAPSVSTLVSVGPEGDIPLGWSSGGTELLVMREDAVSPLPEGDLFILHADGSETKLNTNTPYIDGAAISPDGSRVVFAAAGGPHFPYNDPNAEPGLFVVETDGGQPIPIPYPRVGDPVSSPTFSPDGTRIAYLVRGLDGGGIDVWVSDVDGGNAHEILADEPAVSEGVGNLVWSPTGDRIAMDNSLGRVLEIYTFAPDGSDFATVITDGMKPAWSPDGSQIAYTVPYGRPGRDDQAGLAIADADGSNVREYGLGLSGPWHPATAPASETTQIPVESVTRVDGEVLRFTGNGASTGDLVAVDPETGEERVLVEDLDNVYSARWSPDGRWVAYETQGPQGLELWVIGGSRGLDRAATGTSMLAWSPRSTELATIRLTSPIHTNIAGSTVGTIDAATGQMADVGSIPVDVGDVTQAPTWSPDGRRFVFGARGGAIYAMDAGSGSSSLLVQLPGDDLDSVDQIAWSPDGAHIAIAVATRADGGGLLYVMNADGTDVRVVLGEYPETSVAWSPDGLRLAYPDESGSIWITPMDGSDRTEIGEPLTDPSGATFLSSSDLVWSPDGSRLAFREVRHPVAGERTVVVSALDPDGRVGVERIDELTYESWDGGGYSCEC